MRGILVKRIWLDFSKRIQNKPMKKLGLIRYRNSRAQAGQSLVEYLIIVALVAVSALGMIKVLGYNVSVHFANISKALGGDSNELAPIQVRTSDVTTHHLGDYMKGANSGQNK